MMDTIRPSAFPPPDCNITANGTASIAATTNKTRISDRYSTISNTSSKYGTKNKDVNKQKITTTITPHSTITTETHRENKLRKASQQKYQEHLHSINTTTTIINNNNNSNSMSLWQTIKWDAASFLPLLAFLLLLNCSATPTLATPVFVDNPSLAQFQSGRNIRHLPCIVRKSGRSGVCMFAIDCIKQNGTHLGTCIDRFYFGSCCQLKDEAELFAPEISDNSIDQNTISHFPHESTTLPTSSSTLFKLTTSDPHHTVQSSSNSISETVRNVTQNYLQQNGYIHKASSSGGSSSSSSTPTTTTTTATNTINSSSSISNKVDTTPISTTSGSLKPTKITTFAPRLPPLSHTTHKNSQFVVRTTAKPTVAPTTIKPPRRKTTVTRPILTTTSRPLPTAENRIEVTTQPTKFFTFQLVETTTQAATEPNNRLNDVTSTKRPLLTTNRYRPRPTITEAPVKIITTTLNQTESIRVTTRPKPLITGRPTTSNKPSQSNSRPLVSAKPTHHPIDNNANESVKPILLKPTTSGTSFTSNRRPMPTTTITILNNDELPTTVVEAKVPTTNAPRPRPKPTAEIVKVPKPTIEAIATTTVSSTPKTTPTTPTTKISFSAKNQTREPITTQIPTKAKPTTERTTTTIETTMTEKATSRPQKPTATTTTTQAHMSSTTPQSATLTTETSKIESVFVDITTTTPGLITWTNVVNEPTTMNATAEWASEGNISEQDLDSKITEGANSTNVVSTSTPTINTMISVETSTSEVVSNLSSIMPKPERPSSVMATRIPITKPQSTNVTERPAATISTTITSTTSTKETTPQSTRKPATTSTTSLPTTTTTTIATNTETPIELEESSSSTSAEFSTEGFSTTGSGISGITELNTEDYNGTMMSSTTAPANALEGMDYRQICGRRMFPEPRIVGGSNAAFGRWPWQISLRQWRTSTYLHKCGAALLNENWAITAAHCVENVPPSDLLLRMGEYDLAEEEEPYGYQERRVQIVASHPQFDARTFEYDLALLRFYEPVVFQPNIIPVCVPNSDIDFVGQTAFVTGWGRLYENGPLPSVLQEVAVPVINNTICESMYRVAGFIEHIPHIFICAGWKKGGYDSCEGDSGGPMVLQRENDKRFQLGGVISWGIGCAEANQPGVYTRISEFRDWVNQILQF